MPLVELPLETHHILAAWQPATNVGPDVPVDTTQTIKDTITLLTILTTAQDHVTQINMLTEELTASEAAVTMLRTELARIRHFIPDRTGGTGEYRAGAWKTSAGERV